MIIIIIIMFRHRNSQPVGSQPLKKPMSKQQTPNNQTENITSLQAQIQLKAQESSNQEQQIQRKNNTAEKAPRGPQTTFGSYLKPNIQGNSTRVVYAQNKSQQNTQKRGQSINNSTNHAADKYYRGQKLLNEKRDKQQEIGASTPIRSTRLQSKSNLTSKNLSQSRLGKSTVGKSIENMDSKHAYGTVGHTQQTPSNAFALSSLTQRQQSSTAERAKANISAPLQKQKNAERSKHEDHKTISRNQLGSKSNIKQNLRAPQRQPLDKPSLPSTDEFMRKEETPTPESAWTGATGTMGPQERSKASSQMKSTSSKTKHLNQPARPMVSNGRELQKFIKRDKKIQSGVYAQQNSQGCQLQSRVVNQQPPQDQNGMLSDIKQRTGMLLATYQARIAQLESQVSHLTSENVKLRAELMMKTSSSREN